MGDDFVIAPLGPDDEIDALSSHHRSNPWQHNVSLQRMIKGDVNMVYSVDADSDLSEWRVSGPEPVPNGPGRNAQYIGIHDSAAVLDLESKDLDALEAHDHPDYDPTTHQSAPFPGAPFAWEDNPFNVYYSTERGASDPGDVFNWGGGMYVGDELICAVLQCDDAELNIDALIVYDILGGLDTFDVGADKFTSDAIFFSVAAGSLDPVGDNVYWLSALALVYGVTGGLYHEPGLNENVDALDVHIPEPATIALMGLGLAGLGFRRKLLA